MQQTFPTQMFGAQYVHRKVIQDSWFADSLVKASVATLANHQLRGLQKHARCALGKYSAPSRTTSSASSARSVQPSGHEAFRRELCKTQRNPNHKVHEEHTITYSKSLAITHRSLIPLALGASPLTANRF